MGGAEKQILAENNTLELGGEEQDEREHIRSAKGFNVSAGEKQQKNFGKGDDQGDPRGKRCRGRHSEADKKR